MDGIHGPVLGAVGGIEYKEDLLHLSHGDTVILYTDGVTEAKNPANELFTEKRLVDLLHAPKNESAEQFVAAVISEVEIFQGTAAICGSGYFRSGNFSRDGGPSG